MPHRPMLAGKAELSNIKYPVLVSPKLDGIRATVQGGVLLSRTLKPIPNEYTQELFSRSEFEFFDGELIVGKANASDVWNRSSSGIMTRDGKPDVYYYVFDEISGGAFHRRNERMTRRLLAVPTVYRKRVRRLPQIEVTTPKRLLQVNEVFVKRGFEGLIIRDVNGEYKHGRSTVREGGMLKLKAYEDAEAVVVGSVALMRNDNRKVKNALGLTERSSHKAGKTQMDKLGAFVVQDSKGQFQVGSGFTEAQRVEFWRDREQYVGKHLKYKYFAVGVLNAPRHPVFLGFRSEEDM